MIAPVSRAVRRARACCQAGAPVDFLVGSVFELDFDFNVLVAFDAVGHAKPAPVAAQAKLFATLSGRGGQDLCRVTFELSALKSQHSRAVTFSFTGVLGGPA